MVRCWSLLAAFAGRMPGTIRVKSAPHFLPDGFDFMRRADNARETGFLGQGGEAYGLLQGIFAVADLVKRFVGQAGQYGDGDDHGI